jgi:hypothetical protein
MMTPREALGQESKTPFLQDLDVFLYGILIVSERGFEDLGNVDFAKKPCDPIGELGEMFFLIKSFDPFA